MMNDDARRILVEVSAGELLDKISILEIKMRRVTEASRLEHVERELDVLRLAREAAQFQAPNLDELTRELDQVNSRLWDIEDRIRDCERRGDFGSTFIELARGVYRTNDRRAAIKRQINIETGSRLREEKDYREY